MRALVCASLIVATSACAATAEPPATPPRPSQAAGATTPSTAAASPPDPWAGVAIEPQDVVLSSSAGVLRGVIVKPPGDGPFPALVWNHGSEQDAKLPRRLARFWVAKGFVFFTVFRRGHAGSSGAWVGRLRGTAGGPEAIVAELEHQVDDVLAGADYVRAQHFVDPHRLVVAGCSFGGIETLLTAERATSFRAGLDFAGGAMSWRASPALRDRMKLAASRTTIPVFYMQAENDFSIEPTRVLAEAARGAGRAHLAKIYPPNGTTPAEGHHLCVARADVWGADAMAFLDPLLR